MDDYPARFAALLEQVAAKVRSMTVNRVARGIRYVGLGILALTLGFISLFFLLFAAFGALEIPLTTTGALGLVGGVLVLVGGYVWKKRT